MSGFSGIIRRVPSWRRFNGVQQFVQFQPVTTGDLFEGEKAGVGLSPNLVKLVELVADSALFGSVFLRPSARFAEVADAFLKQLRGGGPHSANFRLMHLTAHSLKVAFTQSMKKYHYIDDQGNVSDALPLAALQKIGLPPTTKVLIEGGKQWINLAEAMAGGPAVAPAPPLPPPPPPSVAAPGMTATIFNRVLADLNRPVIDGLLNRPEADPSSVKPAKLAKSDNSLKGLKGVLKGCLFLGSFGDLSG